MTRVARIVVPLLGLLLVAGCGPGLKDVPLPGTGVSGDTITVRADFAEALNLAEGATVKVNGVDSGKVQGVAVEDFHARAEMKVKTDAELREGATARLRYTTPLGELFVDITNPAKGAKLEEGDLLELADTSTAPTVEDALAQASLLVNGGGLEQLQTVTAELNTAVGGREDTVRALLAQSEAFLTEANATTSDIDRALNSLASVSQTLSARQDVINRAVREIRPAAKVLRENTPGLTELLAEIEAFSAAANTTVQQTRDQLLTIIHQAEPVLAEFVANQDRYVLSLNRLVDGGEVVDEIIPGDYISLLLAAHMDDVAFGQLDDLLDVLGLGNLLNREQPADARSGAKDDKAPRTNRGLLEQLEPISLGGLLGGSAVKILTNRLYLSALGVFLVFAVCVFYLFAAVLKQPLTSRPIELTVELKAAGGLFDGAAVTYRGVKVGKVTGIELTSKGVEAHLRLSAGTEVPEDSLAVVRSLSPVGEQYLDFQPSSAGGPFLDSGDTIPAGSTDIPMSLQSTVIAVNKVLRQIDEDKLHTTLVELSKGLDGTGDELGRLIDDGQLLLEELDRIYPQTARLLRNGDVVLDIAPDKADTLRRLGTSAKQFAAFLRDYDPELRDTLTKAPGQIEDLEALVQDARKVLPGFLEVGVGVTDIFASYEPHIRSLLQTYAPGLGVLTGAIKNNELRIELILDADRRCSYDVARRDPRNTDRRPLQMDGRCSASFSTLQRGAAHAPGPVR